MQTLSSTLKEKRRKKKISLTPLIDVVFILLVFFMLASSFQKNRTIEMVPPQKGQSQTILLEDKPIRITVAGEGLFVIDGESYWREQLTGYLDANRERTFLIETAKDARLQDLVRLLGLSASMNLENITVLPFEGDDR